MPLKEPRVKHDLSIQLILSAILLCSSIAIALDLLNFASPENGSAVVKEPAGKSASQSPRELPEDLSSFAVLELFTSQGCSSCPPADKLLRELVKEARETIRPLYAISFHVDYWNYLGWRDPFSRPEYSERQRKYAGVFRNSRIYTPQMIINGGIELVGSREFEVRRAVEEALLQPASLHLETAAVLEAPGKPVTVRYHISRVTEATVLNVALVEKNVATAVSAGENRGRQLHHANVVREFKSMPLKKTSGTLNVALPDNLLLPNSSIMVYVQNAKTMKILAARETRISSSN